MNEQKLSKEQEERLLLYATYTILYLNDTACFSIQQLGKDVQGQDKESKKIYGALSKRCTNYINRISKIVDKNMDYYCDFCTEMDDICDKDYVEFKHSLHNAYKDASIECHDYFAKVETMRSMVELSVEAGRKIISDVYKYVPKVKWLENYLLSDMMRVANNFSSWAYRKIPKNIVIDFNKESEVMIMFKKLSMSLIDYQSFDKAYRKAVELELQRKERQ